ncbi:MAG: class I SAM-dependent methyltransferase [Proteobacteria bacterium]|nr:class I SAM-dependent methyltransferase [Pseudomonadota bacterium]
MSAADTVFAGSIPELYERYLVPLIFDSYALEIAGRLARTNARNVLEIAAGTGVVTRAVASQLPDAHITATDLSEPMLAHAKSRLPDQRVAWKQADALALPFDDGSFDAVLCQFGVMFFPDKVQAYREAHRVLQPSGYFLFSVWDRIAENEFADIVTIALATMFPDDPPRFMPRTPHGYHDVERIRAELNEAGFSDVSVDAVGARSKARSARDPAIAYCQGTPLRNEIAARNASGLQEATEQATKALARQFGDGPVDGRIRAFVITARKTA